MRRRVTLAIVGTVALTLVLVGLGTIALARFGARERTETELRTQAQELASSIDTANAEGAVGVLARLRRSLDLEGISVLRYGPAGRTVDDLPSGVEQSDIDLARLQAGDTVSGNHGSLVYAASAATVQARNQTVLVVVVVTRQADTLVRPALGWFLLSSLATLAIGALVAWRLGARLARPLKDAEEATRRISAGDLTTRIDVPPGSHDDELASLVTAINAMAEELERSRGLERQFLLSVSHDLRTPLTSIRGYAEAIADGALPDAAAGGTVILAEARRLERLVRDLLDLAKLEARRFSLDLESVDLVDVALGTVDGFRPEADEAGITLAVTGAPSALVSGDPDRLAQVTANLVENALKFATTQVTLSVTVTLDGAWARLDVVDDGPGITDEDLPHVFERLYVSRHHPQRNEAGSGLGLAIVRELVTAMGGHVEAATAPAGGASLSVLLPVLVSVG